MRGELSLSLGGDVGGGVGVAVLVAGSLERDGGALS